MGIRKSTLSGLWAISPLFVFIFVFVGASLLAGDFYKIPLVVVFVIAALYAVSITKGISVNDRITVFSKGAGAPNLMLMVWIFVLAGAFAASAKAMGAIEATVNLTLWLLPDQLLLAGLFVAACFVSLSIGTSVGTIVALVPVAVGVADKAELVLPLVVAVVVGGAFFGDNLSFISDTTVVATRSQGCELSDKFKVNVRIVMPAAILTGLIYVYLGFAPQEGFILESVDWIKIIPYLAVLCLAIWGVNVLAVLVLGNVLTGIIGMCDGVFRLETWFVAMGEGIVSMGDLIVISLLAGGLMEIIRYNGGIDFLVEKMTSRISGKRGAESCIAALVCVTNLCTANNTIAILSVGEISRDIAGKYGVDKRKSASILDTSSCCIQGLIPYGAQLLMASGLSALNPFAIIPFLYYPMIIGGCVILSILFRYPKAYS